MRKALGMPFLKMPCKSSPLPAPNARRSRSVRFGQRKYSSESRTATTMPASVASADPSTPMPSTPMNSKSNATFATPAIASTADDSLMQLSTRSSIAMTEARMYTGLAAVTIRRKLAV